MASRKQLKLAYLTVKGEPSYKILSAKNTTRYAPGEYLSRAAVDDLCDLVEWEIVIIAYDYDKHRARR